MSIQQQGQQEEMRKQCDEDDKRCEKKSKSKSGRSACSYNTNHSSSPKPLFGLPLLTIATTITTLLLQMQILVTQIQPCASFMPPVTHVKSFHNHGMLVRNQQQHQQQQESTRIKMSKSDYRQQMTNLSFSRSNPHNYHHHHHNNNNNNNRYATCTTTTTKCNAIPTKKQPDMNETHQGSKLKPKSNNEEFSSNQILQMHHEMFEAEEAESSITNRRLFFSSLLMSSSLAFIPSPPSSSSSSSSLSQDLQQQQQQQYSFLSDIYTQHMTASAQGEIQWSPSPINKRSGITVYKAEETYNINFITYLSRFLLSFDEECQTWWYKRASDIPKTASQEQVNALRLKQFGSFAASVEVGLQEFEQDDSTTEGQNETGPQRLMASMLNRYGKDIEEIKKIRTEELGLPPYKPFEEEREKGEIKEAKRQIALLFALLEKNQPVQDITKLLAAIDNASIKNVDVVQHSSGYALGYGAPAVTFAKPDGGDGFERATGRAKLRLRNGQLLRIDLQQRGFGYAKPPTIVIAPPMAQSNGTLPISLSASFETATAKAYIFNNGVNKGQIDRIEILTPGIGYTEQEIIKVDISPPDLPKSEGGAKGTAEAILEYEVGEIEIINPGNGYASEKPVEVIVDPPPLTTRVNVNDPMIVKQLSLDKMNLNQDGSSSIIKNSSGGSGGGGGGNTKLFKTNEKKMAKIGGDDPVIAYAYPSAEVNSYYSNRENKMVGSMKSGDDGGGGGYKSTQLPFWSGGVSSASSAFLSLLPAGVGLSFNSELNRYEIVARKDYRANNDSMALTPGKPIDTGK